MSLTPEEQQIVNRALGPEEPETKNGGNGHARYESEIIHLEIARLARLPVPEYERERKPTAARLEMRAHILDRVVEAERKKTGDDGKQGQGLALPELEPWPEPVNGAELLSSIASILRRHVVLPEQAADTVALWSVFTHAVNAFMISPRLAIVSPTKGCGKTTLMDCLAELVRRPLKTSNCPAATLFRTIEKHQPTLLIDEAEHVVKSDNSDVLVVLNSGHRQGERVPRCVGDDHEVRLFSTFAAVAFALNGRLPPTQADRSIHIKMRRRMASEPIEMFRLDRTDHLRVLARKAACWTADNLEALRSADPDVGELCNRVADNWRCLLAIADAAGGDWPRLAREAAAIAGGTTDDEANIQLLADIRDYFAEREVDRVFSADLVKALVALEGRPWAEWGRAEKPMTPHALARQLKKFETGDDTSIAPGSIRIGGDTSKGYLLSQFDDAFRRYLPQERGIEGAEIPFKPSHRHNVGETRTSATFQTATSGPDVTVGKYEKPNNGGHCDGVTVAKGDVGASEMPAPICNHCGLPATQANPLSPWDWRGWPDGIWLHPGCEEAWHDSEKGQAIIADNPILE
jgi:putative DNA primase/helicase